jgi:hypothetical protein
MNRWRTRIRACPSSGDVFCLRFGNPRSAIRNPQLPLYLGEFYLKIFKSLLRAIISAGMIQRNGLTYRCRLTIPSLTQKKRVSGFNRFGGNT